ncbi:TPA: hypothetical protein U2R14_003554 [Raoultella planticola]|uniref:hypothetical protein n=1 Tax=Raoultella planticola TaxID=575 RepID=UPI002AB3BAD1|nr:hypothetical protein [Raoultella planticola]
MKCTFLILIALFFSRFSVAGVQPIYFTEEVFKLANKAIYHTGDPFQGIVNNLDFSIDTSNPMPGASSGWVNNVPTIVFTSSLLNVVFYTAEMAVLVMANSKWSNCYTDYSGYLRSAYMDMMMQMENHQPVSPLIPPERYGNSCEGIDKHYPFSGREKAIRDQNAANAITFIYLHELSHLYYRHVNFKTKKMNDEERRVANCTMRTQEKEADLLAVRKMVKFGWYNSAMDITVWSVMFNTGILETSRNSDLDHPTALERMSYTLDEARGAIIEAGGHISREMSEGIDEAKALLKKADEQLGQGDNIPSEVLRCDN